MLPDNWDTFKTTISNSAAIDGLSSAMVESILLTEEVNRKNLDSNRSGSAMYVRGRSSNRSKSKEKKKS